MPDEYRILVDMRWNKQYLDILANKCNFEDEERYMDFLEALNAVANRYSWRFPVNSILLKIAVVEQGSVGTIASGYLYSCIKGMNHEVKG